MTFFIFFLILLIVILWPAIKLGYKVHKAQSQARRAYEEAFGYNHPHKDGGSGGYGSRHRASGSRGGHRRKVFTADEGEYVEFEEIEVDIKDARDTPPVGDYKPEQQVEDAEWEDIG